MSGRRQGRWYVNAGTILSENDSRKRLREETPENHERTSRRRLSETSGEGISSSSWHGRDIGSSYSYFFRMEEISRKLKDFANSGGRNVLPSVFNELFPSKEEIESQKFQEDFYAWCSTADARKFAYILLNAGKIFQPLSGEIYPLAVEFVNLLLGELSGRKLDAKSISIVFCGIKRLAERKALSGALSAGIMNDLLGRGDYDSTAISHALYAIGELAKEGLLSGALNVDIIEYLLNTFVTLEEGDHIAMSNVLHGVGHLAEKELLSGALSVNIIERLLNKFPRLKYCDFRAINGVFQCVGRLREKRLLRGVLNVDVIHYLLNELSKLENCDSQSINYVLYRIWEWTESGLLKETLSVGILEKLLCKLLELKDCDSLTISYALESVGKWSEKGLLGEALSLEIIENLLSEFLRRNNFNSQAIGDALYGVGELAKRGLLQGKFKIKIIDHLLAEFLELPGGGDSRLIAIGKSLDAVGRLIEKDKLDSVSPVIINPLMENLYQVPIKDKQLYSRRALFCLRMLKYNHLKFELLRDYIHEAVFEPEHNYFEAIKSIKLLSLYPKEMLELPDAGKLFLWLIEPFVTFQCRKGEPLVRRFSAEFQRMIHETIDALQAKNVIWAEQFGACFLGNGQSLLFFNQGSNYVTPTQVSQPSSAIGMRADYPDEDSVCRIKK